MLIIRIAIATISSIRVNPFYCLLMEFHYSYPNNYQPLNSQLEICPILILVRATTTQFTEGCVTTVALPIHTVPCWLARPRAVK